MGQAALAQVLGQVVLAGVHVEVGEHLKGTQPEVIRAV